MSDDRCETAVPGVCWEVLDVPVGVLPVDRWDGTAETDSRSEAAWRLAGGQLGDSVVAGWKPVCWVPVSEDSVRVDVPLGDSAALDSEWTADPVPVWFCWGWVVDLAHALYSVQSARAAWHCSVEEAAE